MGRRVFTVLATSLCACGLFIFSNAPTIVGAGCGLGNCLGGGHAISSITVQHIDQVDDVNVLPVEPDSGETFEVTASWDTDTNAISPSCTCRLTATASVTVDVNWSDATDSWTANCTGCSGAGPIYGVSVCHSDGCGSHTTIDNAWEYELIVDIAAVNGTCGAFLDPGTLTKVEYATTSIDDGDNINLGSCSESSSVSPISQSFSVTDTGTFECAFNCATASGPSLVIIYD